MKTVHCLRLAVMTSAVFGVGLVLAADKDETAKKSPDPEAKIKTALAKLSDADRGLAEVQRFCPVMETGRLGSMGTPVKLMVAGKPVFVCCAGCEEDALANPKVTLAKTEKLKKRTLAFAKLSASDRVAAEAQGLCAIMETSSLGSMGTPVKLMVEGKPVFLCCQGCEERALANPKGALAKAEKLKKANKTPSEK